MYKCQKTTLSCSRKNTYTHNSTGLKVPLGRPSSGPTPHLDAASSGMCIRTSSGPGPPAPSESRARLTNTRPALKFGALVLTLGPRKHPMETLAPKTAGAHLLRPGEATLAASSPIRGSSPVCRDLAGRSNRSSFVDRPQLPFPLLHVSPGEGDQREGGKQLAPSARARTGGTPIGDADFPLARYRNSVYKQRAERASCGPRSRPSLGPHTLYPHASGPLRAALTFPVS